MQLRVIERLAEAEALAVVTRLLPPPPAFFFGIELFHLLSETIRN